MAEARMGKPAVYVRVVVPHDMDKDKEKALRAAMEGIEAMRACQEYKTPRAYGLSGDYTAYHFTLNTSVEVEPAPAPKLPFTPTDSDTSPSIQGGGNG